MIDIFLTQQLTLSPLRRIKTLVLTLGLHLRDVGERFGNSLEMACLMQWRDGHPLVPFTRSLSNDTKHNHSVILVLSGRTVV